MAIMRASHEGTRVWARPLISLASVLRRDDVTDLLVGAVRWVQLMTAIEELLEFGLEHGQPALSFLDVAQFRREQ